MLAIDKISRARLNGVDDATFFKVVRAGFAHPRKLVRRNLEKVVPRSALDACGVAEKARAEELVLGDWVCLARGLAA